MAGRLSKLEITANSQREEIKEKVNEMSDLKKKAALIQKLQDENATLRAAGNALEVLQLKVKSQLWPKILER